MGTAPQPEPTDLRVVGGGEPTAEELAALTVALTPSGPPDRPAVPGPAPWLRAAMVEGVGWRPPTSPGDIDVAARHG